MLAKSPADFASLLFHVCGAEFLRGSPGVISRLPPGYTLGTPGVPPRVPPGYPRRHAGVSPGCRTGPVSSGKMSRPVWVILSQNAVQFDIPRLAGGGIREKNSGPIPPSLPLLLVYLLLAAAERQLPRGVDVLETRGGREGIKC